MRRDGENMTRGESVQPLQSVKLVYQPRSRSGAAWTSSRLVGSDLVVCLDGVQVWFARMESECWHSYLRRLWFHLDK